MSERRSEERSIDEPWNDVPADSDVVPGTEEPDPAEVEGEEGEEHDVSHRSSPDDPNRQDTLDERLAEEVPDRVAAVQDPEPAGIEAPEGGQDDVSLEEGEWDDNEDTDEDRPAEEAAVHIADDERT